MDLFTAIVKSEWPLLAGSALWLLRLEIATFIKGHRLDEATIAGNSFKFRDTLDKVEDTTPINLLEDRSLAAETLSPSPIDEIKRVPQQISPKDKAALEAFISAVNHTSLLDLPPDYIIFRTWSDIENTLYKIAERNEIFPANRLMGRLSVREIAGRLHFSRETQKFLAELQKLRNAASHGQGNDITLSDALRYRDVSTKLIVSLTELFLADSQGPDQPD